MYILFDIGGTKMRMAATDNGESFADPVIVDTPGHFNAALELLVASAKELSKNTPITGVIGGIAGALNPVKSAIMRAPHLPEWSGKNIKNLLEQRLNTKVHIENDAALVGLGEAHFGAGKGYESVAYITVSTGVGGSRIVNGVIDPTAHSYEPGHQIIDLDKSACPECVDGTLESYVSGTALQARFGKVPSEITEPEVWERVAQHLAVGLVNTILHWTPDIIVLGGSMVVRKPGIDVHVVERYVQELLHIYPAVPSIREGTLTDRGGLFGGLAMARRMQGSVS